jgi:hypothetical protein
MRVMSAVRRVWFQMARLSVWFEMMGGLVWLQMMGDVGHVTRGSQTCRQTATGQVRFGVAS